MNDRMKPEYLLSNAGVTNGASSWPPVTLDSIVAAGRKLSEIRREHDRKVFVFDGTAEQFRSECERQGVGTISSDVPMMGLEVRQIGGTCLIGTQQAIRTFLEPKLPDFIEVIDGHHG